MLRKANIILALVAIATIVAIGAPVRFDSFSFLRVGRKTLQLDPVWGPDGTATVTLQGLKPADVPIISIHSTEDLFLFNKELGTSIDFGALEELGSVDPVFAGQSISLNMPQPNFKVLTPSKDRGSIAAIISSEALLIPIKAQKVKNISRLTEADFVPVISDFLIFMTRQSCYSVLTAGDRLVEKCPEFIYRSPYKLDYAPKTQVLTIAPALNKFWDSISVYKKPVAFSYGKAGGLKYNTKGNVARIRLTAKLPGAVSALGSFAVAAPDAPRGAVVHTLATGSSDGFVGECSKIKDVAADVQNPMPIHLGECSRRDGPGSLECRCAMASRCRELILMRIPEAKNASCPKSTCGPGCTGGCELLSVSVSDDSPITYSGGESPVQVTCEIPATATVKIACSMCEAHVTPTPTPTVDPDEETTLIETTEETTTSQASEMSSSDSANSSSSPVTTEVEATTEVVTTEVVPSEVVSTELATTSQPPETTEVPTTAETPGAADPQFSRCGSEGSNAACRQCCDAEGSKMADDSPLGALAKQQAVSLCKTGCDVQFAPGTTGLPDSEPDTTVVGSELSETTEVTTAIDTTEMTTEEMTTKQPPPEKQCFCDTKYTDYFGVVQYSKDEYMGLSEKDCKAHAGSTWSKDKVGGRQYRNCVLKVTDINFD